MPDRPEAASPAVRCNPSSESRAAQLAKFERERLIVDYLNRGVLVSEIAAQVGVGEKRMRAIIREILARRMRAPPQEFVAIQVSRLNEALLVAYSAMSPTNLGAVDRVVKIVRELDRYHGFNAAERRLPEASRLETPVEGPAAFGAALVRRPEIAPQVFETIHSASEIATALEPSDPKEPTDLGREETVPAPGTVFAWEFLQLRGCGAGAARNFAILACSPPLSIRPENPLQRLENVESAPGIPTASSNPEDAAGAAHNPETRRGLAWACAALIDRPEIPLQNLETIESAPGSRVTAEAARADRWMPFASPADFKREWREIAERRAGA